MKLNRQFFNRPTLVVARELLGKSLVRRINGKLVKAMITETEAYCGPKDKANHASKGLTKRTKVMFGPPGHFYIYLIYGMYNCLNIVTEKEGYPAAVLIRGAIIVNGRKTIDRSKRIKNFKPLSISSSPSATLNGPGVLCRELKIDRSLNEIDICGNENIWIEDDCDKIPIKKIKRSKRIGVDYAGSYKDKLWRFALTK